MIDLYSANSQPVGVFCAYLSERNIDNINKIKKLKCLTTSSLAKVVRRDITRLLERNVNSRKLKILPMFMNSYEMLPLPVTWVELRQVHNL